MRKTARQGGVEIVKTVSAEEWSQMLTDSTQTLADGAAAIAELAAAVGQTMEDMSEAVSEFIKRWAEINFMG